MPYGRVIRRSGIYLTESGRAPLRWPLVRSPELYASTVQLYSRWQAPTAAGIPPRHKPSLDQSTGLSFAARISQRDSCSQAPTAAGVPASLGAVPLPIEEDNSRCLLCADSGPVLISQPSYVSVNLARVGRHLQLLGYRLVSVPYRCRSKRTIQDVSYVPTVVLS